MALTPQEQFRFGFLLRCAEEGCSMDEIRNRTKYAQAMLSLTKTANWGSALTNTAKALGMAPFQLAALGIAGSGLAGAGAGYGLAKARQQNVDPEEAKRQELIAAYKLQADRLRQRMQQRSYRPMAPAAPKLISTGGI